MAQVKEIKLSEIAPSPLNPRKTFNEEAIKELAQSIDQNGLIQAITIRKKKGENGEKYEIVCGECRYRAHVLLGRETIESVIKELDDKQAFVVMAIENLQRTNIDPLEEAAALKHLYSKGEVSVKEISKLLGKSISFVANRIQLNNIIPDFVALMRDGTLNLNHLLEISKLSHEQQKILMETCFQPANIERWTFKTLKLEMLREWIDEYVMGTLSAARFDLADDTYATCKACKDCKLNTANLNRFKDTDNPRCMKVALFRAKNQEAVLRQAKDLGLPMVYVGSPDENKDIVSSAQSMLLYPTPLGNREYMVEPVAPDEESFSDPERYKKRYANYERVRSVFDENVEAGLVIKVFEIAYKGILTGSVKYLYNIQADENGVVDATDDLQAHKLSQIKMELRSIGDQRQVERVERQRAFMETAPYSQRQGQIDNIEGGVFIALLASRLPADFRKTLGMDSDVEIGAEALIEKLADKKEIVIREYMRLLLSDKSVGYSSTFASLLDLTLTNSNREEVEQIDRQLREDFEAKSRAYEERIAELEKELSQKKSVEPVNENVA